MTSNLSINRGLISTKAKKRGNKSIVLRLENMERKRRMKLADKLRNATDETEFTNAEMQIIADTLEKLWDDGEDDADFMKWLEEEDKEEEEDE